MGESLGHSPRRCRSTRSGLWESPGTGEASGTPNGVEMWAESIPCWVHRHAGAGLARPRDPSFGCVVLAMSVPSAIADYGKVSRLI